MTPDRILDAAEAVLAEAPPRGWLDCALAVEMILRRAGGPTVLGDYAAAYRSPRDLLRLIRRAGGIEAHFAAVVTATGWWPGRADTGAVGWTRNADAFGHVCGICVRAGAWIVPATGGWSVLKGMDAAWQH